MKNSKKALIASGLLVAVAAMSIAPTISWLSDTSDPVVNTFAGGAIQITLDEAKVDPDGHEITGDGAERVTGNTYNYSPSAVLDKDPTVTVLANSDECYVFLLVDNQLATVVDDEGNSYFTLDYSDEWTKLDGYGDSTKSLYMYTETVAEADTDTVLTPIFTQVTVSDDLTGTQIEEMGEKTIEVTAYAVQTTEVEEADAIVMAAEELLGVVPADQG